jgi:hypothetical protein
MKKIIQNFGFACSLSKLTFLSLTFAFIGFSANAQSWLWAKSAGGANNEYGQSTCTDANNNVLTTGIFQTPTIVFGTATLTNAGNGADVFVVKHNAAGNVLWARSIGGANSPDNGSGIATDPSGNVLITGAFQSPTLTIGSATLINSGNWDIFIAKYDASGNFLWARSSGGYFSDMGQSVSTDASGNVLLTGHFSSSTIAFGSTTLTNSGSGYDIYLVKFDASGNTLWARSAVGTSFDYGQGVSTDASGNVVLTGFFQSPTLTFGTATLTCAGGGYDLFVAKYSASGNVLWAQSAGGSSSDLAQSISTDASGNILVTGYFNSATFIYGSSTLTSSGLTNIFVLKYDAAGNAVWAKSSAGSLYDDGGYGIATDASSNVYVTGSFQSPTVSFGTATLTNAGSGSDIFIVKYNAAGNLVWAKSAGGTTVDYGQSIAIDANGDVLVSGYFDNTLSLGTITLTNGGGNDLFIAKLIQCASPPPPTNITGVANQSICSNNSATLSATSSGSVTWYATPSSSTSIGFGNNFITPTLATGTYTYYAEASTCTVSTSRTAITVTAQICTGIIKNATNAAQVIVYPNPFTNKITIASNTTRETIRIYNTLGSIIYNSIPGNEKTEIDLSDQPSGIYFIKIDLTTQKIIKE